MQVEDLYVHSIVRRVTGTPAVSILPSADVLIVGN